MNTLASKTYKTKAPKMQIQTGYEPGLLVDQSGGMVDDVVHPTLLNDNEAHDLVNVSLDEKGTVKPCLGRAERFSSAFDASNACNGITDYYPDTTTSRLVMGAGTALYQDTPHVLYDWTDQADFEETGAHRCNCDTAGTAGDVKVLAAPVATFARASTKYNSAGTEIATGTPSYEDGKFAHGVHISGALTNLLTANQSSVETDTTGFSGDTGVTLTRDTGQHWVGAASLKIVTDAVQWHGGGTSKFAVTAGTTYTASGYVKGTGSPAMVFRAFDASGTYLGQGSADITLNSTFTRYTITYTMPAGTTQADIQIQNKTAASITCYLDGLQVEAKAYATPWHIGGATRAADSLYYTLAQALPDDWFCSGFWVPDHPSTIDRTNELYLACLHYSDTHRYDLFFDPDNDKIKMLVRNSSGTDTLSPGSALTFGAGDTVAWAFANLTKAYGDLTPGMHIWTRINTGSVVHTDGATSSHLPTAPTKLYIGNAYGNAGWEPEGVIDAVKLVDVFAELAKGTTVNNAWAEAHLTAASAPSAGPAVMLLAQMDDATTATATGGFVWTSASKDVSGASDTASGKVSYAETITGAATMAYLTRSSADNATWNAWSAVDGSGNITSTHDDYIQLAAVGTVSGSDSPSLQSALLSYDGEPTVASLKTGYTAGGQYYFATLLSKLVITNMLDAVDVWDGTAAVANLTGSPPRGQFVAAHKNYLWLAHTAANPSRLYYSDILDIEEWPALNFIDISSNDGDWITGLLPFGDYLIITKRRSVWALLGDGSSTFEVVRLHEGLGCIAPRSLCKVNEFIGFASSEGYYLSNMSQPTLITERLKETWKGLNSRRLSQISAVYYDHKLRIDAPNGSSIYNNTRIVYDTIRQALYLQEFTDHASCYTKYTEAGQEILLYGHATEGQVSRSDYGTTDAGAAIPMTWTTKYFNFGSSLVEKKLRRLYLSVIPASSDVTLTVYVIDNGVEIATPLTATVTGDATGELVNVKLDPRDVMADNKVSHIGYRITQSTTNGGVAIHELLQEYRLTKVKGVSA